MSSEVHHWQTKLHNSLEERFFYMYENGISTDTILVVGEDGIELEAHSVVLIGSSPYFQAAIERWSNTNETGVLPYKIDLRNEDPNTIKQLLRNMYKPTSSNTVPNSVPELIKLYKTAHKFLCKSILDTKGLILKANLTITNFVRIFCLAVELNDFELLTFSKAFLKEHVHEIVLNESIFNEFTHLELETILSDSTLGIEEIHLFKALEKWIAKQYTIINETGNSDEAKELEKIVPSLVKLIRFPIIPPHKLTLEVFPTNLLSLEEKLKILQYSSLYQKSLTQAEVEMKKDFLDNLCLKFKTRPRNYVKEEKMLGASQIKLSSPTSFNNQSINLGETFYYRLKTTKSIRIGGFEFNVGSILYTKATNHDSNSNVELIERDLLNSSTKDSYVGGTCNVHLQLSINSKVNDEKETHILLIDTFTNLIPESNNCVLIERSSLIPANTEFKIEYKITSSDIFNISYPTISTKVEIFPNNLGIESINNRFPTGLFNLTRLFFYRVD